jgi:hypothetical protein
MCATRFPSRERPEMPDIDVLVRGNAGDFLFADWDG